MKFSSVAPGLGGPQLETRKALLLIDLQNDFVDQAGKLFVPNTAKFLNKLPTLINRFRTKGDVFFINTEYSNPRSLKTNITIQQPSVHHHTPTSPAEASMIAGGKLASDVEAFLTPPYNTQASWSQCCLPGSFGSLLPDVLSFSENQSKDMQIVKSYYSPFPDVSFLLHLRKQLVTKLYICGSLSNISVYATVIDAVSHEMSVTIVEDCVGYRDEYCHLEAMRQMADQMEASRISYHELMDDLVRDNDFDAQYEVAFQHVSPSQGLAPGLFPSSWQLPCATNVQEQLFGHTLIAFDCGLLPFGSFQQDSLAAGEQLVQGHDMMAALKGRDCEDRSEAKVLHGILLDVEHPKIELSASAQDHTYVYFCIYENCSTVFREQREWERHDLRSHDAQQYWICQQKAISHMDGQSATCYNISHDRTLHETHVRRHHKVSFEDLVKEYSARDCVNNNHQPQYFCGFCTSPVQYNKEKGKPGWRERFNHLAKHMKRRDKLHRPGHEYIKEQEGAAPMDPKNINDIISVRPSVYSVRISTKATAYFPDTSNGSTVVFFHIPGGFNKVVQGDRHWLSHLTKALGCICVTVDHDAAVDGFRRTLSDCERELSLVREYCSTVWKAKWGTDPTRVILSGIAIGVPWAMTIAIRATQDREPVYGLVASDPVIDTNPCAENEQLIDFPDQDTLGLTTKRLKNDLTAVFKDEPVDCRDLWYNNPSKMPDDVLTLLPPTVMAFEIFDASAQEFMWRLQFQGVQALWGEFAGIHNNTAEAQRMKLFVEEWCKWCVLKTLKEGSGSPAGALKRQARGTSKL